MSLNNSNNGLIKLFPPPMETVALDGLYLSHELQRLGTRSRPFVYAGFVVSLDGRISLPHPAKDTHVVPDAIANPRDWRLFQELSAQADVLITSGRYIRQLAQNVAQDYLPVSEKPEFADLTRWRESHGLMPQPAVVILSGSLNLPVPERLLRSGRPVYVATGAEADPIRVKDLEAKGIPVITAGRGSRVEGRQLITELGKRGFTTIDMVAGPDILHTLMADGTLNRLYLTHSLRVLGGISFDTLSKGVQLNPPADFSLHSLYYDTASPETAHQLFAVYEATPA